MTFKNFNIKKKKNFSIWYSIELLTAIESNFFLLQFNTDIKIVYGHFLIPFKWTTKNYITEKTTITVGEERKLGICCVIYLYIWTTKDPPITSPKTMKLNFKIIMTDLVNESQVSMLTCKSKIPIKWYENMNATDWDSTRIQKTYMEWIQDFFHILLFSTFFFTFLLSDIIRVLLAAEARGYCGAQVKKTRSRSKQHNTISEPDICKAYPHINEADFA